MKVVDSAVPVPGAPRLAAPPVRPRLAERVDRRAEPAVDEFSLTAEDVARATRDLGYGPGGTLRCEP